MRYIWSSRKKTGSKGSSDRCSLSDKKSFYSYCRNRGNSVSCNWWSSKGDYMAFCTSTRVRYTDALSMMCFIWTLSRLSRSGSSISWSCQKSPKVNLGDFFGTLVCWWCYCSCAVYCRVSLIGFFYCSSVDFSGEIPQVFSTFHTLFPVCVSVGVSVSSKRAK